MSFRDVLEGFRTEKCLAVRAWKSNHRDKKHPARFIPTFVSPTTYPRQTRGNNLVWFSYRNSFDGAATSSTSHSRPGNGPDKQKGFMQMDIPQAG
jgi:hypothetical protein